MMSRPSRFLPSAINEEHARDPPSPTRPSTTNRSRRMPSRASRSSLSISMASHHKPSGLPPTPARLPPSARSAVPSRLQPQHSSSGSNPWLPSPSLSTRAAFSSGLSKGLATLAGTASSAAGQVSTLLGTRETEAEHKARTPVDGSDSTKIASSSDGSKFGVRATVGGWIGRGNKKRCESS